MNTYLKSTLAAAAIGLGIFASAGSAYAAGCLTPDQTNTSLSQHDDDADYDAVAAANAKGFRCDVVGTDLSVRQPAKVTASVSYAAPQEASSSILSQN